MSLYTQRNTAIPFEVSSSKKRERRTCAVEGCDESWIVEGMGKASRKYCTECQYQRLLQYQRKQHAQKRAKLIAARKAL